MSVLITGGSGLLGSHLNIKDSYKPSSKELNLLNYSELQRFIETNNIKKIVHCAALVGGVHANKSKIYDFFNLNLQINLNVINACKMFNLHNSVFILSTCILPANGPFPLTEEMLHEGEPHYTNYGYAYAKRMLEVGARSMLEQYNTKAICVIPCNFYGANDNHNLEYGHVIPSLIHKCYLAIKNNTDLIVWGSGKPEREFIYVKDLAYVIEQLINTGDIIDYPQSVIISSNKTYSIEYISKIIVQKMNFKGNVIFDKTKPDGILKKPTNNALFTKYFPNYNYVSLEDGLDCSIDHFTKNYPNIRK